MMKTVTNTKRRGNSHQNNPPSAEKQGKGTSHAQIAQEVAKAKQRIREVNTILTGAETARPGKTQDADSASKRLAATQQHFCKRFGKRM